MLDERDGQPFVTIFRFVNRLLIKRVFLKLLLEDITLKEVKNK